MNAPAPAPAQGGLADLCVDLIKLATSFQQTPPTDAEALYNKCDHLFGELASKAQRAGIPPDLVDAAKYGLAALIDEKILTSNLPIHETWLNKPLQLKYFDSFSAGEEFYNKLELYRHGGNPAKVDVLEAYFLCMAFGFKGKYADARGMERRKQLMEQLLNEINAARGATSRELSPHWESPAAPAPLSDPLRWRGMPVWVVPAAAAVAVIAVYLIMYSWLGGAVAGFTSDFPVR